jgi:radical SAM protein with 4Fe4S-binding SPASM domain
MNGSNRFHAHITVTGGEPFMRADFFDLLEKLVNEEEVNSFAVLTNGTMITPDIARYLRTLKPGFVQVSIDGSRETHDGIRGAGSYDLAVSGLKQLIRAKIPTHISFTAHRGNFRDFPYVAKLGRRLGVDRVWSDRMVPCGRGELITDGVLTPEETREFIATMQREQDRSWLKRSPVALIRSLQFTTTGIRPYRCSAADTLVAVLPNGDVCPCRRMPLVAGNLLTQSLEDIYYGSELFNALRTRERVAEGCTGCFYARTCNGGSRCLAAAVYGDLFHADPGCWLAGKADSSSVNKEAAWSVH